MAFKIVDSTQSKLPKETAPLDGSTAVTKGSLLYADKTNGVAKVATSSAGDVTNILGVATQTVASGATSVEYIPLETGTLVEADCNANTAANQLLKNHVLTSGLVVNNTSTTSADVKAIFFAKFLKGAAADKKLLGNIIKVGHVTA